MTLCCVNGRRNFIGKGAASEKPLAGKVLTFLCCLTMEARNSKLMEGEVQHGIRGFVGPYVHKSLLRGGLVPGTKVNSYCGAIAWLLTTYAEEADLNFAESRLGTYRQGPDETLVYFRLRECVIRRLKPSSRDRSSISCLGLRLLR